MEPVKKGKRYMEGLEQRLAQTEALRFPAYPPPKPVEPEAYPDSYDQAVCLFTHIYEGRFEEHLVCRHGYKERNEHGVWVPANGWRRHDSRYRYFTSLLLARMYYRWQLTVECAAKLLHQDNLINELKEDENA